MAWRHQYPQMRFSILNYGFLSSSKSRAPVVNVIRNNYHVRKMQVAQLVKNLIVDNKVWVQIPPSLTHLEKKIFGEQQVISQVILSKILEVPSCSSSDRCTIGIPEGETYEKILAT